jgi:hypothetical protein
MILEIITGHYPNFAILFMQLRGFLCDKRGEMILQISDIGKQAK